MNVSDLIKNPPSGGSTRVIGFTGNLVAIKKQIGTLGDSGIKATIGSEAAGIGALTTVISAPIALPLECIAIVGGVFSGIGKFISRKLETKAKKHNEVYILAEAKLNTISNQISKPIEDGSIKEPEFKLITDEVQKYRTIKEDIRSKTVKISATNAQHLGEKKR